MPGNRRSWRRVWPRWRSPACRWKAAWRRWPMKSPGRGWPACFAIWRRGWNRGEKLETAIAAQGSRLPADLRGLIVAGVRSGRLPIVLDQFAALARRQQDLRRRVLLILAYPALLLGIMAALMVFCHLLLAEQFDQDFPRLQYQAASRSRISISASRAWWPGRCWG